MASREDSSAGSDQTEDYKTDHKRRGLALIFNQEYFHQSLNLDRRKGTATDKDNLTKRFQELDFEVKAYDDKKKEEILHEIRNAAKANHKDADCFVCIFLSHGEDGHVYAYDEKVDIKEVTAHFRDDECTSLVGKPKIFIFQACRGHRYESGVTPMSDDESEVLEEAAMIYTLPAGPDFLMCYSVAEGFVSFRNIYKGSYYIQDLCETLQEHGSTLEFTELLTLVNMKMSRRSFRNAKQMPCFTSALTMNLYLKPKKKSNILFKLCLPFKRTR